MDDYIRNKILVVGNSLDTHKFLQELIRVPELQPIPCSISSAIKSYSYTIDNKYYSSDVEFWLLDTQHIPNQDIKSLHESLGNHCDAIVLWCSLNQGSWKSSLEEWVGYIEEQSPNVLLCVASDTDGKENSEEYEDCNNWCTTNGIEFVTLTSRNMPQEEINGRITFAERFGCDRVMEALETNMWGNMQYKSTNRPTSAPSNGDASVEEDEVIQLTETFARLASKSSTDTVPPQQQQPVSSQVSTEDLIHRVFEDNTSTSQNSSGFQFDLDDFDQFEKTLVQLSSLREKAQNLPDKERRELAAKIALSFMQQLGDDPED